MAWSRVLSFNDPFPYQATVRASDVEMLPTKKGKYSAELTQINFNRLWMQRFHEKQPQIHKSQIRPGRKVIAFLTGEQPPLLHRGKELSPRDIIVCNYDVMHHRTAGESRFGSMSLTIDDFDAACKAVVGQGFSGLELKYRVQPSPALMLRLLKLHENAGRIAKTTPDILENREVVRALEHELTHAMIRCLTEGVGSEATSGNRRQDRIVARFEGFLEANPDQPLYLTEICASIGVAERTLRGACDEQLGMGPIRYLKLRRMHLVRRALLRADPSTATVTRLATDHGFWELGRFAVAYRTMIGESPSVTLHRPADDNRLVLNRPTSFEGVASNT